MLIIHTEKTYLNSIIDFPVPPRRMETISPTILRAISSGVVPEKSKPAGECTRFNSSGVTPSSSKYSKTNKNNFNCVWC